MWDHTVCAVERELLVTQVMIDSVEKGAHNGHATIAVMEANPGTRPDERTGHLP